MDALIVIGAFLLLFVGYAIVRRIAPGGAPDHYRHLPGVSPDITLGDPYPEQDPSDERRRD